MKIIGKENNMVNENKGEIYRPRPVYCRKLIRSVIRAGVAAKFGNHNVSRSMAFNFKKIYGKG